MLIQIIPALCLLGVGLLCFVGFLALTAPDGEETDAGFERTENK